MTQSGAVVAPYALLLKIKAGAENLAARFDHACGARHIEIGERRVHLN
jgi:hypothetical protein